MLAGLGDATGRRVDVADHTPATPSTSTRSVAAASPLLQQQVHASRRPPRQHVGADLDPRRGDLARHVVDAALHRRKQRQLAAGVAQRSGEFVESLQAA